MEKKVVWILNHYATFKYFEEGGRHFWIAENLKRNGYQPIIICANVVHNSDKAIDLNNKISEIKTVRDIPFMFVRTNKYKGNGIKRIVNMLTFYKNSIKVMKNEIKKGNGPDYIYVSSPHLLTILAGLKISKKYNIPLITEIRDLWPASIVAYTKLTNKNLIIKVLYNLERYIYQNSDRLIFTMEGGKDYIRDKGWDRKGKKSIDLNKISYINNGVDYDMFMYNKATHKTIDEDLDSNKFKVIYTGSIRTANNIKNIIDVAQVVQRLDKDIVFIFYGSGNEKEQLMKYVVNQKINNVVFKGGVDKKKIPYILSRSDLNILNFQQNDLRKYGASINKLFEYFASGKPTISDCRFGYDLIEKYGAGVVVDNPTPEEWAREIIKIRKLGKKEYNKLCENAIVAAEEYDFKILTQKLIEILENLNFKKIK